MSQHLGSLRGPGADQVQLMLASLPHLLIISSPAIMMRKPDTVNLQSHRRQYLTSSSFAALFHVYCMLGQGSNSRRYLRHYEDNDKMALCNAKSWFEPFCKAIINMYLIRLKAKLLIGCLPILTFLQRKLSYCYTRNVCILHDQSFL